MPVTDLARLDTFPELETARLRLRELVDDDAPALLDIFSNEIVTRHYDIGALTELGAAQRIIALMRQRYSERIGIRWAVVHKQTERFIGTIGFNSITAPAHRAMLGYELTPTVWGRGLATEAVRRVVRFGHDELGLHRIEATVMLENHASARVLHKAHFEEEGTLRAYGYWKGAYHDLRMFSILRGDAG